MVRTHRRHLNMVAITLVRDAILNTRDLADFRKVPGL
jgi:hypothetical protein